MAISIGFWLTGDVQEMFFNVNPVIQIRNKKHAEVIFISFLGLKVIVNNRLALSAHRNETPNTLPMGA